eukprot:TRINITY_DN4559_c0_g1_i1.p1 TRINITY_DN4559_c0_g1~~TRINITY_DN4559_c0_g1_i1.p1  ORF type:complete len:198 (+),score=21.44 TRINITY_DN4559_c0_g1_i1:201-794(+)
MGDNKDVSADDKEERSFLLNTFSTLRPVLSKNRRGTDASKKPPTESGKKIKKSGDRSTITVKPAHATLPTFGSNIPTLSPKASSGNDAEEYITFKHLLTLTKLFLSGDKNCHINSVEKQVLPQKKVATMKTIFQGILPSNEEIAVLYDDTTFGSAKSGFLLTMRGVYWKNDSELPKFVAWQSLRPGATLSPPETQRS